MTEVRRASSGLSRSAGRVGLAVALSRVLGLVREVAFTTLFGAGRELDAFVAAFRIPNLLRDLFAEGALSAAFVSTFTQKLERDGKPAAWALASRVLNDLVLVVGLLTIAGILASPAIVDAVAPGFRAEPGKSELTILLTRVLFPFLLFVAAAAVAMGILNACGVFGVPALASSFFNAGSIVGGVGCAWLLAPEYLAATLSRTFGGAAPPAPGIERALLGMALGTLGGGALQFLVQVPALRRVGFRWRPLAGFSDPGVRQVLRLMGPATLGIAAVQVNVVVNTFFASSLGNGPVSWLNVAFRLMYLPIGMFGVAVGTVALPSLARAAARSDLVTFRKSLDEGLRLLVFLCVPAAVGLVVLAEPVIALIYEHGRFGAEDTAAAAVALSAYAIGLSGYALVKLLGPAFYALDDAGTPARVSLFSVALNLGANALAVGVLGLGHGGLALSTSLVALWNSALLLRILRRRIGGLPRGLFSHVVRTLFAAVVMGAAVWAVVEGVGPGGFLRRLVVVGTAVPLGMAVYAGLALVLGMPEARRMLAALRRRGAAEATPPGRP